MPKLDFTWRSMSHSAWTEPYYWHKAMMPPETADIDVEMVVDIVEGVVEVGRTVVTILSVGLRASASKTMVVDAPKELLVGSEEEARREERVDTLLPLVVIVVL